MHQTGIVQRFVRMARRKAELDKDKIPPWKFAGYETPGLTDDEVFDTWRRYKDSGALLVAGGQLDQPPEWWRDIDVSDALYNTLLEQAYDEAEQLKPDA